MLVIGGSGFLGSNVIRSLNSSTAVSVSSADLIEATNCISKFYHLDILDKSNIYSIAKNFDVIINCTGQITEPIDRCKELNSIGINNICTVANELDIRLIHVSSVAVYGSTSECSEDNPLNPETVYGELKVNAENEIICSMDINKFVILRVPNLYGNSQKKGIISYIIKSLTSDRKLNFNNDGNMFRTFFITCL